MTSVMIDADIREKLDSEVQAGIFNSRSEAIEHYIKKGMSIIGSLG